MPTTGRTGRAARVAAAVRAAGRTPARRWLLVAGVLAGAWFAGAAPAAADAALQGQLGAGANAVSERVADTPAGAHGAGAGAEAPVPAAGAPAAETPPQPASADTAVPVEPPAPEPPAVPEASAPAPAADAVDPADTDPAPGSGGPSRASGAGKGGSADLGTAVDAVRGIGRDAGRAVPLSVGPPDHAAADSVAAASGRPSAGLPDLGMSPFAPGLGRGAAVLPGLDLTGAPAAQPDGDTARRTAGDSAGRADDDRHARTAPRGGTAPSAGAAALTVPAADAAAEPADGAETGSVPDAADPPASAATVGSAPQAPQYGGFCAAYLPVASSAAPAAGLLPCDRRALAAAPRDLGGEPTFSPD
ncbi:hypothetical protein ACFONH_14700 [Streptomonospora nanhaiensis]|uniref:Uncharacterized protein n=1 Tax=Streptomonospora nanhaiensis TaxID=1323731 RepID=A0A853BR28_9ACTN|nr:hypothetical protein [Streptomonospora nanhaiensis]MBX9389664.1 hypothetical protein [Streptomonospora nanhaiensis]NYI96941.1 hypothetical protein [Streptomonospora nanhaiensis]